VAVRPTVLTIAGSDPSGGAGVQADLKTMCAFGVYGMAAVTSITVQNTLEVRRSHVLPADLVADEIDAVLTDIPADAAKTGMLATAGIIDRVAERVKAHGLGKLVVDPVMRAASGASLIDADAVSVLRESLLPLALVVTPNVPEAEALTGIAIETDADAERAARALYDSTGAAALVKGGHRLGESLATDILFDGSNLLTFAAPKIDGGDRHGTGCTLSAAIASALALGNDLARSVALAKDYTHAAIVASFEPGKGSPVLDHLVPLGDRSGRAS